MRMCLSVCQQGMLGSPSGGCRMSARQVGASCIARGARPTAHQLVRHRRPIQRVAPIKPPLDAAHVVNKPALVRPVPQVPPLPAHLAPHRPLPRVARALGEGSGAGVGAEVRVEERGRGVGDCCLGVRVREARGALGRGHREVDCREREERRRGRGRKQRGSNAGGTDVRVRASVRGEAGQESTLVVRGRRQVTEPRSSSWSRPIRSQAALMRARDCE